MLDNQGLSHYTSYLALGLSKYRNIILYSFNADDHVTTGASDEKKIKVHYLNKKMPKIALIIFQPILMFFILFRVLGKMDYDIVHLQGHLPIFFLYIPFLKYRNKRICWTMHDINLRPSRHGILGKLELIYINILVQPKLLCKYSDAIIVHGSYLKKQLSDRGVEKSKINVIPHFDYRYLLRFESSTALSNVLENYVLFFGRIVPYKGIEILINASRIIRAKSKTNINILISGVGDVSYIRRLLTEEDYKYIYIHNEWTSYDKLPELFRKAKFLVLPYTDASQSGVLSLAYTFAKPVIVSNIPSLVEYVEHNKTGLIFDINDSNQLANYMIELIENNAKCIEMGKRGYQKLVSEMSLEICCENINNIYSKLVL